jgi:AraC-like DNA-binding protein
VHEYLVMVRIAQSARFLSAGSKADTVAFEVGYKSKTHFYRHFRRLLGTTPRQFQESRVVNTIEGWRASYAVSA